jgi:hypothetical protein
VAALNAVKDLPLDSGAKRELLDNLVVSHHVYDNFDPPWCAAFRTLAREIIDQALLAPVVMLPVLGSIGGGGEVVAADGAVRTEQDRVLDVEALLLAMQRSDERPGDELPVSCKVRALHRPIVGFEDGDVADNARRELAMLLGDRQRNERAARGFGELQVCLPNCGDHGSAQRTVTIDDLLPLCEELRGIGVVGVTVDGGSSIGSAARSWSGAERLIQTSHDQSYVDAVDARSADGGPGPWVVHLGAVMDDEAWGAVARTQLDAAAERRSIREFYGLDSGVTEEQE